jgi:hypothetical protein
MEETKIKSDEYRAWLRAANSNAERTLRRAEYKVWYKSLPEADRAELRVTFQPELDKISDRLRVLEGITELATKGSIPFD